MTRSAPQSMAAHVAIAAVLLVTQSGCNGANGANGHTTPEPYRIPTFTDGDFPFRVMLEHDPDDPQHSGGWRALCLHVELVEPAGRTESCELQIGFPIHHKNTDQMVSESRARRYAITAMNRAVREYLPNRRRLDNVCKTLSNFVGTTITKLAYPDYDDNALGHQVNTPCDPGTFKTRRLPDRYCPTPLRVAPDQAFDG